MKTDAATSGKKFDLQERTARFGENVINLARQVANDPVNQPVISQLVRSATSIGANYAEAGDTQSTKDFRYKIGICLRESRETRHWLRMLARADESHVETCRQLWKEAHELTLIFAAIVRKVSPKHEPS